MAGLSDRHTDVRSAAIIGVPFRKGCSFSDHAPRLPPPSIPVKSNPCGSNPKLVPHDPTHAQPGGFVASSSNNKWSDAARRFGFYFIGLAIGLMLLGFFQMKKQQQAAEMRAREQAAEQAAQQAAPPSTPQPAPPANTSTPPAPSK